MAWLPVLGFGGAVLVALADQATKEIVRANLAYGEVIPLTGFFNLVYHHNTGAAFGMFASASSALLVFSLAAMIVLGTLLLRVGNDRWSAAALAAMLGGAAGNVIDRLRHGAVVDWLDFHAAGWHWPAFNLADSALMVGVAIYLLGEFMQGKRGAPEARSR